MLFGPVAGGLRRPPGNILYSNRNYKPTCSFFFFFFLKQCFSNFVMTRNRKSGSNDTTTMRLLRSFSVTTAHTALHKIQSQGPHGVPGPQFENYCFKASSQLQIKIHPDSFLTLNIPDSKAPPHKNEYSKRYLTKRFVLSAKKKKHVFFFSSCFKLDVCK